MLPGSWLSGGPSQNPPNTIRHQLFFPSRTGWVRFTICWCRSRKTGLISQKSNRGLRRGARGIITSLWIDQRIAARVLQADRGLGLLPDRLGGGQRMVAVAHGKQHRRRAGRHARSARAKACGSASACSARSTCSPCAARQRMAGDMAAAAHQLGVVQRAQRAARRRPPARSPCAAGRRSAPGCAAAPARRRAAPRCAAPGVRRWCLRWAGSGWSSWR